MYRIIFAIVLIIFSLGVYGQIPIDYLKALSIGKENDLKISENIIRLEALKTMLKAKQELPNTEIGTSWGQINDYQFDNELSISQTIPHPKVHQNRKKLTQNDISLLQGSNDIHISELRKEILSSYFLHNFLEKKQVFLMEKLLFFDQLLNVSKSRKTQGESDAIELALVENRIYELHLDTIEISSQISRNLLYFRYLLNTDSAYIPVLDTRLSYENLNEIKIDSHPMIAQYWLKKDKIESEIQSYKYELLPEFKLGVSTTSLKSVHNRSFYSPLNRMETISIGLSLPIFTNHNKTKQSAKKLELETNEKQLMQAKQNLKFLLKSTVEKYTIIKYQLDLFDQKISKNNQTIVQTALQQFGKGEINYLQWVSLIEQPFTVVERQLLLENQFNNTVIELDYLTYSKSN